MGKLKETVDGMIHGKEVVSVIACAIGMFCVLCGVLFYALYEYGDVLGDVLVDMNTTKAFSLIGTISIISVIVVYILMQYLNKRLEKEMEEQYVACVQMAKNEKNKKIEK